VATTPKGLPYPLPADSPPDVPAWMESLATKLDSDFLTRTDANAAYATKAETGRLSFGANALAAGRGAPGRGVLGTYWPVWLLDATTDEGVGMEFTVPQDWAQIAVDVVLANAGTGTGNIRLRSVYKGTGVGDTLSGPGATSGVTVAAAGQNVQQAAEILVNHPVTPGQTFMFMAERLGGHAEDTLGNDIGVLALVVRKVA
jgi:hypothetical protein